MTNIEQSNEKRQRSQAITQTEWEQYMAEKILRLIRHELYMDFRYMDVALSALSYQPKEGVGNGRRSSVLFCGSFAARVS